MNALTSVLYFLVSTFFSVLIMVLWLKIILRYFRVSHLNPLSQVIYRFTDPWLGPIERRICAKTTRLPQYDWVTLASIAVIETLKFLILGLLAYGLMLPFPIVFVLVLASLIVGPCNLLFYALLIRVVLSWLKPHWEQHPMAGILIRLTDPLIQLGHKIIPNISGFDFGPFIMMIILKVLTLFISALMPLPLI